MIENVAFKNLPNELKYTGLFCGWKFVKNQDGDIIKKPFNVLTEKGAKPNDPSTFVSYPEMLNHIHKYFKVDENGKQLGGIGLGIFKGFSAIDIDHCVDEEGNISELAKDIINFCQSYTEFSPSKSGIRIIFKTEVKIDKSLYYIKNSNLGLEIYISDNTSRFVTLTGNKISGDTIKEIDISPILDKYMKKSNFTIDKILKKDEKLAELWNKQAPGSHSNESELDMTLCCKLAYYFKNDKNEVKKYFELSPYYQSKDQKHKNKWNNGYGLDCIEKATNFIEAAPAQPMTKKFELNDTGNAHRFIDMFGTDLHYNVDNKIWMMWNGNYWQYDIQEYVKNLVEILAEKMIFDTNNIMDMNERMRALKNIEHIYSTGGKEALLKESRHINGIPITNDLLDRDSYLLCTDSGTYNFKTRELEENKKENLISMSTGYEISYEKPERFIKFLEEMFDGNQDLIHYIHKAMGYSATDLSREQCMFILHGDGNNGKSLLLDVIKTVLGSYGITSKPQLLTEQKFGNTNSEEVARLKGKRFVAVEEIKEGDKLDEQLVKSLTSGIGNQVARFLYGNSFEFPFKGKIWMATNYEPIIRGFDKGIWRRIVKIPVFADFTGREDKDLREKLLKEAPQILGWLIEGFKLYMEEGLEQPEVIKNAITAYREDMDLVQQWINEYCDTKPSYFERANILYDSFRAFCQRRDQRTNQTQFGRNLGKKYKKYNSGEGIVYIGLRLKKEATDLARKVAYEQITISEEI